ncbi:hypothetical protein VTI74DRAFT_783 [Chaetomium olivicolor]
MLHFIPTITLALCAVAAPADPVLGKWQAVTCGENSYTQEQIADATDEGCRLYSLHQQVGTNNYPHTFRNHEGLSFPVPGPYQEFPILENGLYLGGAPGADRIVFKAGAEGACDYVGAMTHTGAANHNGFVLCAEADD